MYHNPNSYYSARPSQIESVLDPIPEAGRSTTPNNPVTTMDPNHPVPDGTYIVEVKKVQYKLSPKKQTPQLQWLLEIIAGPYQGIALFRANTLHSTKATQDILKKDLKLCGVTIPSTEDLQNASTTESLVGQRLEVQVVNKEPRYDVYLRKKINSTRDSREV